MYARRILLSVAASISFAFPLSSQPAAHLSTVVAERTTLTWERGAESVLTAEATVVPTLTVFGEHFEFSARAEIAHAHPDGPLTVDLDTLEMTLYPFETVAVAFGRFDYMPGYASLLSNSNVYTRTDVATLLSGRVFDATVPGPLGQVRAFAGDFYAVATGTAFVLRPYLPAVDSPWFPDASIPQSIQTLPHLDPIPLESVEYADLDPDVPLTGERLGYSLEVGGYLGGLELSLMWYNGWDNTPLLQGQLELTSLTDPYSITLRPVYRKRTSITANARLQWGRVVLVTDNAYTFYRLLATNELDSARLTTGLTEAQYFEHTAGATVDLPWNLSLMLEYRLSKAFTEVAYVPPSLHRAGVGLLRADLFDRRLGLSFGSLVSFDDWSAGVLGRATWTISDSLEVDAGTTLFVGDEVSELGQYSAIVPVDAALRWRF
ncbi:MAG: hypothetical protein ACOCZB_06305 [Spirochaetota bacterium]